MASTKTPKSILKKTNYPATTRSKADRDREIALYHANVIQQRKDIEDTILRAIETLIDYPLALSPYNASNPSPTDAKTFKTLLRPFRPSDYDSLIQERNINEHCGFTLCPNARIKDRSAGTYKLLGKTGKAKDFKILETAELDKWCSDACGKRALYVRVQLSETAAWERQGDLGPDIELLDEAKTEEDCVANGMEKLNLKENDKGDEKADAENLALERGDTGLAAKTGLVDVSIKEKEVKEVPKPPSQDDDLSGRVDEMHLNLEGYTETFGSRRHRRHEDELDEDEGEDWL